MPLKPCLKGKKMMTAWEVEAKKPWTKHRPKLVKYLRKKGVLRQALEQAAENAGLTFVAMAKRGVAPWEAQREARIQFLLLPDEESVPILDPDQAPFGQPGTKRHGQQQAMKTLLQIIAGVVIFILYFAGKGARDQSEQIVALLVGMAIHLVAMLILFVVFFRWHRTRISPLDDFKKARIPLALGWFFVGGVLLFGAFSLLVAIGLFGGEFTQTQIGQSLVFDSGIAVLMAVAALVSATGLLYGAKWAQVVVVILSFWVSMGIPGLFLAVSTWWMIGSNQLNTEEAKALG